MNGEEVNDRERNFSENFVIVSARKTDFTARFIEKLRAENNKAITPEVISKIVSIVAKLDPILFLSQTELKERHILIGTSLEDLDRNKIGEEIAKRLSDLVK
jgi:hypothetical protein